MADQPNCELASKSYLAPANPLRSVAESEPSKTVKLANAQGINLRRYNEVIAMETSNLVSPESDRHPAPLG